jgi:hypothetical protein
MLSFKFRKIIRRNSFTQIFKSFGKRRFMLDYKHLKIVCRNPRAKRTKMQRIRRANQGHRNKIYGRLNAIKMQLMFGRYPKVPQFRR